MRADGAAFEGFPVKVNKIRMVGFKSFADETLIDLQEGITSIVGPNGCGKSNILDAVRWVLGEKSARGLRGKSMEDVIFLGSEHRKPAGMAEVEIYFDNADRALKVDADEVVIGRRLYLSSASEYYLNHRRSTRRDIERVLMDTGIGKSSYSIMEQGRMSEILKSTPESRRVLIDEAAGVSRFKMERKETLDRLDDTEQNLLRLGDILKAKREEMENLERQAKKTRRYMKLKEQLDEHDRNLRYLKYVQYEEQSKKAEEQLGRLTQKRDESLERQRAAEVKVEEIETRNQTELEEMHRLDRSLHQDMGSIENMNERLKRISGEKDERQKKREQLQARLKEEEKKHKELEKRHAESKQLELNLNQDLESLVETQKKIEASVQKLREQIEQSLQAEEAAQQEIQNGDERQSELLTALQDVTRDLILELERKKRELESREGYRGELKESLHARLKGAAELQGDIESALSGAGVSQQSVLQKLYELRLDQGLTEFERYESIEQEFRQLLFDKSGLLARKEELDREMHNLASRREELQGQIQALQAKRKELLTNLDKEKNRKVELELRIRDAEVRRESQAEAREGIEGQLAESQERLGFLREEYNSAEQHARELSEEETRIKQELESVQKRTREQTGAIEGLKKKIEKARSEVQSLRERARKERETFENILPEISKQERTAEQVRVQISTLEEELYNDFQISLGELEESCQRRRLDRGKEEAGFKQAREEIRELGAFNALAIEELERARESYDELEKQRLDIEDARKNILSILKDIDDKSQELFKDTFERIQVNFTEIFQTLFGGGSAAINLSEPDDVMNSGVDIMVQPPGKKNSSVSLLSGGEQSMTAIALMFAMYLVRPSPFCFLDEIDAPLDDNNVGRFLRMLGRFAPRTQFLVITHNKLTMSRAEAIFGVTQEEAGVSKMVSVRMGEARAGAGAAS